MLVLILPTFAGVGLYFSSTARPDAHALLVALDMRQMSIRSQSREVLSRRGGDNQAGESG